MRHWYLVNLQAYSHGWVLLLDELNLAPDDVLRCLEQVLDNDHVVLSNKACAAQHRLTLRRHPSFCMVATQNPAADKFRGKRERLSPAFLSRFTRVVLSELPLPELQQVSRFWGVS